MKKIQVEICMCTSCIISGSPQVMESVEKLKELHRLMQGDFPFGKDEITIIPCKGLSAKPHREDSPVARVNGKLLTKTSGEKVMQAVLACIGEKDS